VIINIANPNILDDEEEEEEVAEGIVGSTVFGLKLFRSLVFLAAFI
jgi:hypothetical protein